MEGATGHRTGTDLIEYNHISSNGRSLFQLWIFSACPQTSSIEQHASGVQPGISAAACDGPGNPEPPSAKENERANRNLDSQLKEVRLTFLNNPGTLSAVSCRRLVCFLPFRCECPTTTTSHFRSASVPTLRNPEQSSHHP